MAGRTTPLTIIIPATTRVTSSLFFTNQWAKAFFNFIIHKIQFFYCDRWF